MTRQPILSTFAADDWQDRIVKQSNPIVAEFQRALQHHRSGRTTEAEAAYRRVLAKHPKYFDALVNLGSLLRGRGKFAEAFALYDRAIAIKPDEVSVRVNLANAKRAANDLPGAVATYREALRIKPQDGGAWTAFAWTLFLQNRLVIAARAARNGCMLTPHYGSAWSNLGATLYRQGLVDDGISAFRRGLRCEPQNAVAGSNLLFTMHFSDAYSLDEMLGEAVKWNQRHAAPVTPPVASWPRSKQIPGKRLRVGFVSPDLRRHPVSYFFASMLEHRDREKWEVVCYSDVANPDAMTARIEAASDLWRSIKGLSDAEAAAVVARDEVDILFDLVGHTGEHRLLMFARKPAAIQATWIGYFDTTGMDAMDYLIADPICITPEADRYYVERVIRLRDGFLCYDPPEEAPEVGPLPARTNGYVTFGTANQISKFMPAVIDTWAELLRRAPTFRLRIKTKALLDQETRQRYADLFVSRGIDPSRIDLLPPGSQQEILAFYNTLDIALDTFPCAGGTTTCEALWMGVPVVTFLGERFCGRHSGSHLTNVGIGDLVLPSQDAYVDGALALAADLDRLEKLRSELRQRVADSPLTDAKRFAESFELALEEMYRRGPRLTA